MERSEREDSHLEGDTLARRSESTGQRRRAAEKLLTPGEVARLFGVDPKTVSRWADAGRLEALRTLGGHRRYRATEVRALLEA